MSFSSLLGQERVAAQLLQLYKTRLYEGGSLLFLDKNNLGLPMARALAAYIHCDKRVQDALPERVSEGSEEACGICTSCIQMRECVHPDVHYIYPVAVNKRIKSNPASALFAKEWQQFNQIKTCFILDEWLAYLGAEDKQGNISVRDCEEIVRQSALKPVQRRAKVFIVWFAEYLGKMGNKLLKVIEEPPKNTYFIFVVQQKLRILPTLLSRMSVVVLPPVAPDFMTAYLMQNYTMTQDKAADIALRSEGSYYQMLRLAEGAEEAFFLWVKQLLNTCFMRQAGAVLTFIEAVSELGKEELKSFLKYVLRLFSLSLRSSPQNPDQAASVFLQKIRQKISLSQTDALTHIIQRHIYYIERNAHIKLLLYVMIIQMRQIIQENYYLSAL